MRTPFIPTLLLALVTATAFAADPDSPTTAPVYTLTPARITQLKATEVIYQPVHIHLTDADTPRKAVEDLMAKLATAHVRITGGPIFIFPQFPAGPNAETDLDIAIPVPDKTPAPEGCQSKTLDAAPSVTALYQGPSTSMGEATGHLFQQLRTLHQLPTGELRTRSLYYEDPASSNNIVLLEIPVTPNQ
jgi:hypothetical protein